MMMHRQGSVIGRLAFLLHMNKVADNSTSRSTWLDRTGIGPSKRTSERIYRTFVGRILPRPLYETKIALARDLSILTSENCMA